MKNLDYREYYRRNLPHVQPRGATFLANFRLADSLPIEIAERLRAEANEKSSEEEHPLQDKKRQDFLDKWDDAIHQSKSGPFWLKDERIAEIVAYSIRYHDGKWFDIVAYCIMPNHVHLILTPCEISETVYYGLTQIMHNIKRNSANHANKIMERTGAFWQHESYDHVIRDEAELERIVKYVLYNPVKAGLVKEQSD